jgi:hypothetical protein
VSNLKDDLIAAKALIDTPEKWLKDAADDFEACCALRAIERVHGTGFSSYSKHPEYAALQDALPPEWVRDNPDRPVGVYNDHPTTTHADIMALFDRAIANV